MFILSYVLVGCYFVMLWPFMYSKLRLDEDNEIRSISAMICQLKPLGHFVMSLGNLILFEVMSLEHKEIAWAYWVALQLVLCFDVDEYKQLHFLFLLLYIVMLMLFWGLVTTQHDLWVWTLPLWISTGLFTMVWFFNMMLEWWMTQKNTRYNIRGGVGKMWVNLLEAKDLNPKPKPERWKYHSLQSTVEIIWVGMVVLATWRYEYILRKDLDIKSDSYSI